MTKLSGVMTTRLKPPDETSYPFKFGYLRASASMAARDLSNIIRDDHNIYNLDDYTKRRLSEARDELVNALNETHGWI